jgi:hypothetical protein
MRGYGTTAAQSGHSLGIFRAFSTAQQPRSDRAVAIAGRGAWSSRDQWCDDAQASMPTGHGGSFCSKQHLYSITSSARASINS